MMQPLNISPTEFSPRINFSPETNKFEIQGESRPENTAKFYSLVLDWIQKFQHYLKQNPSERNLIFEFRFDYFNSTSAKFILDLFRQLDDLQKEVSSVKIHIRWHFDKLDEDMRDSGEEFSHLVNLPFEFIAH